MHEICKTCELVNCGIKDPVNYKGEEVSMFRDCVHYTCVFGEDAAIFALRLRNRRLHTYITEDDTKEGVSFGTLHKPTFRKNGRFVRIVTPDRLIYSKRRDGLFVKTGQKV
jgi:hypothetical protein